MKKFLLFVFSPVMFLSQIYSQDINEINILPNNGHSNANFGNSTAIEDDVMVVGSFKKTVAGLSAAGEVYVYRRIDGNWELEKNLLAPDRMINDQFGTSVSIYGNKIAVGAPNNSEADFNSGAVYIFEHDGNDWVLEEKLLAGDAEASDNFGFSVCLSSDKVLIGSPNNNGVFANTGAAYIYDFDGSDWNFTQKITSGFPELGDENFGYTVALDDTVAVIGSPLDDDAGVNAGTGYVFRFNGASWAFEQKLIASDGDDSHNFSFSLDIEGSRIVAGAFGGNNSVTSSGSCYVFDFDGATWNETAVFYGPNPNMDNWLGYSVAISGETFVVGAINDNTKAPNCGVTHVYRWDAPNIEWIHELTLYPDDGGNGDQYGASVAIDSFDIVVGSTHRNISGANSGKAYYYDLCTYTPRQQICMASVDSSSSGHYIMFEKPRATMIDSFFLYKLDETGQSVLLQKMDYQDDDYFFHTPDNIYFDSISYTISTKNICGNESETDNVSRTMTLFADYIEDDNVELTWTPYLGYDFTYYRIFRDDNGTGDFVQIGAMLKTIHSFVDINPTGNDNTHYRIDAWDGPDCNTSLGYSVALSNTYNPLYASVTDFNSDNLSVYPNPANDFIYLVYDKKSDIEFNVTNLTGKLIYSGKILNHETIRTENWANGMYLIHFKSEGTTVHQEKIVVAH